MPSISGTRPTLMGNLQQQADSALPYTQRPYSSTRIPWYAMSDPGAIGGLPQPTPDSGGGGYPQPVGDPQPVGVDRPRGGSMSAGSGVRPGGWEGYRDWITRRRRAGGGSLGGGNGNGNGSGNGNGNDDGGGFPQPVDEGGGFPQPIDTTPHGSAYVPAYAGDIASGWGVGPTTAGTGLGNAQRLAGVAW